MRSHFLRLVALTALGASAFLIPAGIAPPEGVQEMSITVVNPKNQIIRLPCSACVFSPALLGDASLDKTEQSDETLWIQGAANDVLLNFTISGDQSLDLNGHAIYPVESVFVTPQVHQVSSSASVQQIESGEAQVTPLDVTTAAVRSSGNHDVTPFGDSLISMTYTILGLEDQPITLNNVDIELLKTMEGELLILDISSSPSRAKDGDLVIPSALHGSDPSCGSLPGPLCDMKNFFESKIESFRKPQPVRKPGCGGRKPHIGKVPGHLKPGFLHPEFQHEELLPVGLFGDRERPPHRGPHHDGPLRGGPHHGRPHHPHHHHHSFFESLARGFVAIVVPTLIGVAVGVSISVFGLIIGRLCGLLWHKLVRGDQQGYQSLSSEVALLEENAEGHDEKIVFQDELRQESPPVYEDVPAYEKKDDEDQR